ncbi:MAG: type VI secretion system-associated protein TagF [Polyangiaceae bacterium]|nr:type VI secretion system-associated protein TagF [Polyangiaceae bacterium]
MGKIPSYPEFIHGPRSWEPAQSFDAWLEAGISAMGMRYGASFEPFFEQGAVYGFTWRAPHDARADSILCGVLLPSQDSVGRHFPLAVMAAVPYIAIEATPHVVPLALGDFLDRTYDAVTASVREGPEQLAASVGAIATPRADDWALAAAEYEEWCNATVLSEAWSGLYAEAPFDSALDTIDALAQAVDSVRGVEAPAVGPSVRLPLGQAGSAAASLWLDIIRRLCGWQKTIPTAFWADSSLLVPLGDAAPSGLGDLWITDPTTVFDLTSRPVLDASSTGATANARPDGSVTDFLNSLSR